MQGFTSVPFKTESGHGLNQVNGVAKFSPAGIVLQYESKLFGIIPGGFKESRLPVGEILDVKFRKGFMRFAAKIEIRMRNFAMMAELPNNDGKVVLKLARDDFERGRDAAEQLQREIAAREAQLPPPQTPVEQLFRDETEQETKLLNED